MVLARQQDGPRRLRRGASSTTIVPRLLRVRDDARRARHRLHPDQRARGRQRRRPLRGDALVRGPPLLEHLETVQIAADRNLDELRFPVQYVIRDHATRLPRLRRARSPAGVVRPGDEVLVLPSGQHDDGRGDRHPRGPLDEAVPAAERDPAPDRRPRHLARRPHLRPGRPAPLEREFTADVCWMADAPLRPRGRYLVKHAAHTVAAIVDEILDRVDVHTLDREPAPGELALNDIGRVRAADRAARSRSTPTRATARRARSSSSTRRRTTRSAPG